MLRASPCGGLDEGAPCVERRVHIVRCRGIGDGDEPGDATGPLAASCGEVHRC